MNVFKIDNDIASASVAGSFVVSVGKRFVMLLCVWLLGYIIASVVMGVVVYNGMTPAKIRICLVVQDLLVFVVPAIVTAVVVNRRPARLLMIDSAKGVMPFVMMAFMLIAMVPAMNMVISWNQSLTLPDSMVSIYDWMVESERSAGELMGMVTGETSVGGLIMSLLIIGVLAGFSEELFFRGALQNMMIESKVSPHIAIWLTSILFSAMHLQFFGFFPRMILGLVFGYLAYWSGSIWLPMSAHILNNSVAVVAIWIKSRSGETTGLDTIGTDASSSSSLAIICVSILFSLLWLWSIRLWYRRRNVSHI